MSVRRLAASTVTWMCPSVGVNGPVVRSTTVAPISSTAARPRWPASVSVSAVLGGVLAREGYTLLFAASALWICIRPPLERTKLYAFHLGLAETADVLVVAPASAGGVHYPINDDGAERG